MRLSRPELRSAGTIRFGNRIIQLPVEGALRMGALIGAVLISLATAASMMADWPKFALYWYQPQPPVQHHPTPSSAARWASTCLRSPCGNRSPDGC